MPLVAQGKFGVMVVNLNARIVPEDQRTASISSENQEVLISNQAVEYESGGINRQGI